jgi:hypothetical protein
MFEHGRGVLSESHLAGRHMARRSQSWDVTYAVYQS